MTTTDVAPPRTTPLRRHRIDGVHVLVKDETTQVTGSFKYRGAANYVRHEPHESGYVTASTGNHGAGVAAAGLLEGRPVEVFVPVGTPLSKQANVRHFGADVRIVGASYDEARIAAIERVAESGHGYVPSFDHDRIIAGNATLFTEVLAEAEQAPHVAFVPVGGGGLLAGALGTLACTVVGVELDEAPAMARSLASGRREVVDVPEAADGVEGLLVRQVGALTFDIARRHAPQIALVSRTEIRAAVRLCWDQLGVRVEGAGAASVAAMRRWVAEQGDDARGLTALCVLTGGNIDVDLWAASVQGGRA